MKTELNEFPTGDKTVLQMIESGTFDAVLAETLLSGVDLNAPICDLSGYSTTYLRKAVDYNDLPAVAFLLAHGADPNLHLPELFDDCALFQLQFLYPEHDPQTRYEISKLFFRYGADPNIKIDGDYLYMTTLFSTFTTSRRVTMTHGSIFSSFISCWSCSAAARRMGYTESRA